MLEAFGIMFDRSVFVEVSSSCVQMKTANREGAETCRKWVQENAILKDDFSSLYQDRNKRLVSWMQEDYKQVARGRIEKG